MDCREAILSNDYADFIYTESWFDENGTFPPSVICTQPVFGGFGILYADRSRIPPLSIQSYPYPNIPKLYTTLDTTSMEASGILRIQNQPVLGLKGRRVLIGFVDTGIDYQNPVFTDEIGESRILRIWDQTVQTGKTPEGFYYGSEYTNQDIEVAKRSNDPLSIVPSVDTDGHGTFMASIAAGKEDRANDFVGAAPEAYIAMVKLKQAKSYLREFYFVDEGAVAYQENDIMLGIRYLLGIQMSLRIPMVICLGLGTNTGGHVGRSPVSKLLELISDQVGTASVVAAGNEANRGHHYYRSMAGTEEVQEVEIRVGSEEIGFTLELWADPPEQYSVSIISPTGEVIPRIPTRLGAGGKFSFVFERTEIYVDYQLLETFTGSQLIFMRFAAPTPGIWVIRIYNNYFINGSYHMWLPITGLIQNETVFLNPDPDTTLTVPSSEEKVISVGAYQHTNNSIDINSGRGFTRTGTVKPDLVAPGVNVYGALPGGRFSTRTGTSVAAAHTAGAAALVLQWGIGEGNSPQISTNDIKAFLIRGANRSQDIIYPSRIWGYGTLDLYRSFELLRG